MKIPEGSISSADPGLENDEFLFEETDLKDKIKSKLFGIEKQKDASTFDKQLYNYLVNDYINKMDSDTVEKNTREKKNSPNKVKNNPKK